MESLQSTIATAMSTMTFKVTTIKSVAKMTSLPIKNSKQKQNAASIEASMQPSDISQGKLQNQKKSQMFGKENLLYNYENFYKELLWIQD